MAEQTKIEWCDATANPWIGCTRVSPACDDCYAARSTPVRTRGIEWGPGKKRQRTSPANWKQIERWNRDEFMQCANCKWRGDQNVWRGLHASRCCVQPMLEPARRRVFCASLADWLDNEVPIEWLVDLLDLIRRTPNLDWLLLTKRIGNWRGRLEDASAYRLALVLADSGDPKIDALWQWIKVWLDGRAPNNVWLGATVVNQNEADRDVPKLLQVSACVRFLSIEPMLGAIDLRLITVPPEEDQLRKPWDIEGSKFNALSLHDDDRFHQPPAKLDWIIVGGESGPKARPIHPVWIRSLRDQCAAAGVPFIFKQWGAWVPVDIDAAVGVTDWMIVTRDGYVDIPDHRTPRDDADEVAMRVAGKKAAGNLLDGRQHLEWPA